jgi:DNA-binding NarL/FixJ family response regulator
MKILLVDDHILFAKSLSIALCDNPEIEQFSSTKDIQNLEKQIATELPDILLIDINLGGLTDEERKVLELVASGVRRREIAEQLFISERTVSNHLQHIFEKLQVSSTVEMITKAIKLGYIAQSVI